MKRFLSVFAIACCTLALVCSCNRNNRLTRAEKAEGWQLLFNGKDMTGWRDYNGLGMVLLTLFVVVVSIEFFSEYLRKKLS